MQKYLCDENMSKLQKINLAFSVHEKLYIF